MEHMYANSSAITTTESGEVFLTFSMEVPEYDENGNQTGTQCKANQMIVMSSGAYRSFKEMLDSIKESEKK